MTWVASSDRITDFCQNWSFLKLWRFEYYEEFKIWFSLFCRVLLLALFFFVSVFISCLFRSDEWHNYFTSVIGLYNRVLSKIGPFEPLENLALRTVWNLVFLCFVEFCISLIFSYLFYFLFFCFLCFFSSTVISNWEAFGYSHCPTANIIKKKRPIMQLNKVHHG